MADHLRRPARMLTLIEGGDIYTPEHVGVGSVLLVDGKVGLVGEVDRAART